MAKIIVSGSLAYDQIMDYPGLFSEYFIPGKLHNINLSFTVEKTSVGFGGTAGNIAYNLALLKENPEIISTVGGDFKRYGSHLIKVGIDPSSINIIKNEMTAAAYVMTDKADNQISAFHYGAGGYAYQKKIQIKNRSLAIIAPGNIQDMNKLAKFYQKEKFPYLYDPGQQITLLSAEALRNGIKGAEILFVNDYELALIIKKTGWSEKEILKYTQSLVVTLGAKGCRIVSKDNELQVKAVPVKKIVDPTGAGDAFRAGFIKGLVSGFSPQSSAKLASTVAAFAIEKYGTQSHHFSLAELKKRYKKAYNVK